MSEIASRLRTPAIISTVLVLPFMILELVNRRDFHGGFRILVFALMWLLPLAFMLIASSIVPKLLAGGRSVVARLTLLPAVALLILIAWLWVAIVIDQMPCFLGVPLCD